MLLLCQTRSQPGDLDMEASTQRRRWEASICLLSSMSGGMIRARDYRTMHHRIETSRPNGYKLIICEDIQTRRNSSGTSHQIAERQIDRRRQISKKLAAQVRVLLYDESLHVSGIEILRFCKTSTSHSICSHRYRDSNITS